MEVVRVFNNELSSLYEVKPPISKAKMTQITKCAIKGIKFYKHIVQSVEKFIQKCRPEYKIPGLYVVDSIVRQSRHQFGADKDVFGPRFLKNITTTFHYLFKCSEDDKSKIVRVLNLWQKNAVFPSDVIQPLLDMANPNTAPESISQPPINEESQNARFKSSDLASWKEWPQNDEPVSDNRSYPEISVKNLEKFTKDLSNSYDDEASHSSQIKTPKSEAKPLESTTIKFNKKLLDFDYGEEDEEEETKNDDSHLSNQPNALALSMAQNLLLNPELLRQLQQMQQTIQQNESLKLDLGLQSQSVSSKPNEEISYSTDGRKTPEPTLMSSSCSSYPQTSLPHELPLTHSEVDKDDRIIPEPPLPSRDLDERSLAAIIAPPDRIHQSIPYNDSTTLPFQYEKNAIPFPPQSSHLESLPINSSYPPVNANDPLLIQNSQVDEDDRVMYSMPGEPPLPPQDYDERSIMLPMDDRGRKERSRSRSRSRGRSGRHRSRSKSPRRRRSRSRSHSRKTSSRSKERERIREKERERERERERQKKGIPPIKKGYVSVCSTTIWLGHVPKSCSEIDISSTFGPYGTILSIDMIPPRGCAYVVMDRRQDGYKALQRLKNLKLQGSSVKMAWAPGKGVKSKDFKDYWDVDLGVSYIPFEKIQDNVEALDLLEEGGFIDEDSLPEHLKALRQKKEGPKLQFPQNKINSEPPVSYGDVQPLPTNMVPPPMITPTSGIPMVMPHLMQPQFGLHLPGLLPPQAMVMPVPMGIPPPNPVLMVPQQPQNILNQSHQMVGNVPPLVSRTVPPPSVHTVKSTQSDVNSTSPLPTSYSNDATPTEDDGTVDSSSAISRLSTSNNNTNSTLSSSTPHTAPLNPMMGLHNTNRPLINVPPPVSTAGTPIPFPPPNIGFGFPPPGLRPPGPNMNPAGNSHFPWIPKSSNFSDADGSQSVSNTNQPRSSQLPLPGLPHNMYSNRPPFPNDPLSSNASANHSRPNESYGQKNRNSDLGDNKNLDVESSNKPRNSPGRRDKMHQDMPYGADDESSMDHDYSRNMGHGPLPPFDKGDFPRGGHDWMRGPPGHPMQGGRFPRNPHPGLNFPRMGGINMRPRMDMDFLRHPGPRGPRMHMPRGLPPRRDNPNWYPDREFEHHLYDRDLDRRKDQWIPPPEEFRMEHRRHERDWNTERDRNNEQDRNNERDRKNEGHDRDKKSESHDRDKKSESHDRDKKSESHDRDKKSESHDRDKKNESSSTHKHEPTKENSKESSSTSDKKDSSSDKSNKPKHENKTHKSSLMDDFSRLKVYARENQRAKRLNNDTSNRKPSNQNNSSEKVAQTTKKTAPEVKTKESQPETKKDENSDNSETQACDQTPSTDSTQNSEPNSTSGRRERDKESRKRSRWGRTLSEEREFQQQRRNEIEMKFQSYELSHNQAPQIANTSSNNVSEKPATTCSSNDSDTTNLEPSEKKVHNDEEATDKLNDTSQITEENATTEPICSEG